MKPTNDLNLYFETLFPLASSCCCHCFFFGRDEIYCQICKQLTENNGTRSRMQGWILLSVCLGIFPPTDLFLKVSVPQVKSDCPTKMTKKPLR